MQVRALPLGLKKNNKYLTMEIGKEQIKEYLEKYNIKNKENLASHIEELKRNTVPNTKLISELVYVLEDDYFFRAPHTIQDLLSFPKLKNEGEKSTLELLKPLYEEPNIYKAGTNAFENVSSKESLSFRRGSCQEETKNAIESLAYKETVNGVCKEVFNPIKRFGLRGIPKTPENSTKGKKTNSLKPQMSLLFKQFPKALEAVVLCSQYGHEKYKETDEDYLNYTRVDGGSKTYADAGLRHRLEQGNDSESGLPHQFHVAWNALAELELWIKENK